MERCKDSSSSPNGLVKRAPRANPNSSLSMSTETEPNAPKDTVPDLEIAASSWDRSHQAWKRAAGTNTNPNHPSVVQARKSVSSNGTVPQYRGRLQETGGKNWNCAGYLVLQVVFALLVFYACRHDTEARLADMKWDMAARLVEGHVFETMPARNTDPKDSSFGPSEEPIHPLDGTVCDLYRRFDSEIIQTASVLSVLQSHLERHVKSMDHQDASQMEGDMELGEQLENQLKTVLNAMESVLPTHQSGAWRLKRCNPAGQHKEGMVLRPGNSKSERGTWNVLLHCVWNGLLKMMYLLFVWILIACFMGGFFISCRMLDESSLKAETKVAIISFAIFVVLLVIYSTAHYFNEYGAETEQDD